LVFNLIEMKEFSSKDAINCGRFFIKQDSPAKVLLPAENPDPVASASKPVTDLPKSGQAPSSPILDLFKPELQAPNG
jgi:hypothetical protein